MVPAKSRTLYTAATIRLLRLLIVTGPLDVAGISRALGVRPSLVRRRLWALQRIQLVCGSLPAQRFGPTRFAVNVRQLQDALVVAAQEMGTAVEWRTIATSPAKQFAMNS